MKYIAYSIIQSTLFYTTSEVYTEFGTDPRLRETAAHVIAMSVLVLNLRKIQCALLSLFTYLMAVFSPQKNGPLFSRHYLLFTLLSALISPFDETWKGMSRNEGFLTICIYVLSFLLLSVYGRFKPWLIDILGGSITLCCIVSILQLFGWNPLRLYPQRMSYYDAGIK